MLPNQKGHQEAILTHGRLMIALFRAGQLDEFLNYMPADMVEKAGGRSRLKKMMGRDLAKMLPLIESISLVKVSEVVSEGKTYSAFVEVESIYKFPGSRQRQKGYYVASSADGGRIWKFISSQGSKKQEDMLKARYPVLTGRVPFPQCGMAPAGP